MIYLNIWSLRRARPGKRFAWAALVLLVACGEAGEPADRAPAAAAPRQYAAWPWADRPLRWQAWGPAAFAAARAADRPVLLYLAAPGCEGTFAADDAALQSLVEERFVPVRVDPFRRPDIARRYAAAGWPAVAVVDGRGRTVAAAADLAPDRARLFLARILHHLEARPEVVAARVRAATAQSGPAGGLPPTWSAAAAAAAVAATFDRERGGFGGGVKAPEWPVLLFLLDWHAARDTPEALAMVEQTLTRALEVPMWDATAGGVHAYSYTPDWGTPHGEKDAADQGGLLLVLSRLPILRGRHIAAMAGLIRYLEAELVDPADSWCRGRQVRLPGGDWWTDPLAYADRHALVTGALLAAADRLEESGTEGARGAARLARRLGMAAADALASGAVDGPGRVAHWVDAGRPGLVSSLLEDQILVAWALLAAEEASGEARYGERARQVLDYAGRHLWDEARGAFDDGPGPGVDGLEWAAASRLDGALPDGNALAAVLYLGHGAGPRRGRLVRQALPPGPPGRAHATWARALLAHDWMEDEAR